MSEPVPCEFRYETTEAAPGGGHIMRMCGGFLLPCESPLIKRWTLTGGGFKDRIEGQRKYFKCSQCGREVG